MKDLTKIGLNYTGIKMSPLDSQELISFVNDIPASPEINSEITLEQVRVQSIREAGIIGSVPFPVSITGSVDTLVKKISEQNLEVFIDKLSERAAFERTGVRLYDALIAKIIGLSGESLNKLDTLKQFREEEVKHFKMVISAIESIGADPTVQTPCADIIGVSSLGIIQVITDPRTNLAQSLNALLIAELTDNAGWELLIELAKKFSKNSIAQDFETALIEENNHLITIKDWLFESVMEAGGV